MALIIRPLETGDTDEVVAAFAAVGWGGKLKVQYERYLSEQAAGTRETRFAFLDGQFAGYLNVLWTSSYPPFAEADMPEVNDFNVLPHVRRRGIGTALMDEAERVMAARSAASASA